MGRSPCCDKVGLKKGPWTPDEDQKLLTYIQQHGHGNWQALPSKAGLERHGKSCRLRWTNYLRPDIKRGKFSLQEEQTIIQLHALLGNRWSAIATNLPKRTDNEIKNYWNTHLKKKLSKMGIDPMTHRPKNHALGSNMANISHMAQWESARLEAEARLVHQPKPITNPSHSQVLNIPPPQPPPVVALPLAPPPWPPCLDTLKAWAWTNPGKDISSMILHGFVPLRNMNFMENLVSCKVEKLSNNYDHEDKVKGIMGNSLLHDHDPIDFTYVYDPLRSSNLMSFTEIPLNTACTATSVPSGDGVGGCWRVFENKTNCWGNVQNFRTSPTGSSMF